MLSASYYEKFKPVRNKIGKYPAGEIIQQCSRLLRVMDSMDERAIDTYTKYPPWFLLILIKWTLMFGEFSPLGKKPLKQGDFMVIINMIHAVDGTLPLPSQYENLSLFFRGLAYQQFWFQEGLSQEKYARQNYLFGKLDPTHVFHKWFERIAHISIKDFLSLGVALSCRFLDPDRSVVNSKWFSTIIGAYPSGTTERFLETLAATPLEIKNYLNKFEVDKDRSWYEFRERSPLIKFPLLNLDGEYMSYSRIVLLWSLQYFIYDTLRSEDPEAFMNKFGAIFENYIRRALDYIGVQYLDESKMGHLVGRNSKVPDFCILSHESNILIDAKGVELAHLGMVSHRPDIITDKVKQSVMKGILQGVRGAEGLAKSGALGSREWKRDNNYLLLVTFKDLFLGSGGDFYENVAKERLVKLLGGDPASQIIPLEHIFIVSVDDFDWLIEAVKRTGKSMGTILSDIVNADQNPKTKCFVFRQHLANWFPGYSVPKYLSEEFENMLDDMQARLKINESAYSC